MIEVKITFYKYGRDQWKEPHEFEVLPRIGEHIFDKDGGLWEVKKIYHSLDGDRIELVVIGDS